MPDWPQHQLSSLAEVCAQKPRPLTAGDDAWRLEQEKKTDPGPALIKLEGSNPPDGDLMVPTKTWVGGRFSVLLHALMMMN